MKEEIDLLRRLSSRISVGERVTSADAVDLLRVAARIESTMPKAERPAPPREGEPDILRRLHWFRYSWASSTMDQIIADAAIAEIREMSRKIKAMEETQQRDIRKELYDGEG
jgi:hypothetical protein